MVDSNNKHKTNILFYSEGWGLGGIERFIMNVIDNLDYSRFSFDIFCTHDWNFSYDRSIRNNGGNRLTVFHDNKPNQVVRLVASTRQWKKLLSSGKYDVVHINTMNGLGFIYAEIAKSCSVPIRIVHSHNSDFGLGHRVLKNVVHHLGKIMWTNSATNLLACTTQAGQYLFRNRSFTTVPNGIDIKNFSYDDEQRHQMRSELGISDDTLLFGSVGRLGNTKNPLFQLSILKELLDRDENVKLVLVGDGPLRETLLRATQRLQIDDYVILPGVTNRPQDFLSALDIVTMPSLFEGLPFSVIEAAANGLPILISDSFNSDSFSYGALRTLPIAKPETWASVISATTLNDPTERARGAKTVKNMGYDIEDSVSLLQKIYSGDIE